MARQKPFFLFGIGERAYDEDAAQIDNSQRELDDFKAQTDRRLELERTDLDNSDRQNREKFNAQLRDQRIGQQDAEAQAKLARAVGGSGSDVYNAARLGYARDVAAETEANTFRAMNEAYTSGLNRISLARQQADSQIKSQSFAIEQAEGKLPNQLNALLGGAVPIVELIAGVWSKNPAMVAKGAGAMFGQAGGSLAGLAQGVSNALGAEAAAQEETLSGPGARAGNDIFNLANSVAKDVRNSSAEAMGKWSSQGPYRKAGYSDFPDDSFNRSAGPWRGKRPYSPNFNPFGR